MDDESHSDWGSDSTRELSGEEIQQLLEQARAKRARREAQSSEAKPADSRPGPSKDSQEPPTEPDAG